MTTKSMTPTQADARGAPLTQAMADFGHDWTLSKLKATRTKGTETPADTDTGNVSRFLAEAMQTYK